MHFFLGTLRFKCDPLLFVFIYLALSTEVNMLCKSRILTVWRINEDGRIASNTYYEGLIGVPLKSVISEIYPKKSVKF